MKTSFVMMLLSAACAGSAAHAQGGGPPGSVEQRRVTLLREEVTKPFPSPVCGPTNPACINGQLTQALAIFSLGDRAAIPSANAEVAQALAGVADGLQTAQDPSMEGAATGAGESPLAFHFVQAALLYRMMRGFGQPPFGGDGSLSPMTADLILRSFRVWSARNCPLANTAPAAVWNVWGTENHDAQRTGACWAAADLMRRVPAYASASYVDGSRPAEQYSRWTKFEIRYLDQRAHHGTMEFFSPTYSSYALSPVYGYADFSDDPALKQASRAFLDLWWVQWAQESLSGCYGGAENRAYPQQIHHCPMGPVPWMYFAQGDKGHDAPGFAAAVSSGYAPPRIATILATDPVRRGSYETLARSPGLRGGNNGLASSILAAPAILRIGYVTPTFVVGTPVVARLPWQAWNPGAVQNERAGVTMAGHDQIVVFQPQAAGRGSSYNGLWGLQSHGTQVLALAPPQISHNVRGLRVLIGSGLTVSARGGWTFLEGTAYAAFRPLAGGVHADPGDAGWMIFDTPSAPIVVQTSPKSRYPSLAAFQAAVMAMPTSGGGGQVTVQGLDGAARIDFSTDPRQLGRIGGRPVDPTAAGPNLTGPFVKTAEPGGAITLGSSVAFPAER